jgi:hypothetical protein
MAGLSWKERMEAYETLTR